MSITRRHMLLLLPAAAIAWKHILAGTPEAASNYKLSDHWWSMLIDLPKCIGCGNCVRACQTENDVSDGYFRTWVERYHVTDYDIENPHVDSPDGGKEGFPPPRTRAERIFLCPSSATIVRIHPVPKFARWARRLSARMAWFWSTRSIVSAAGIVCRRVPTVAASSIPKRRPPRSALSAITGSLKD